jgi:hypothetical protein
MTNEKQLAARIWTYPLTFLLLIGWMGLLPGGPALAQLPREPVQQDRPVYNVFWSGKNVGISTVRNPSQGSLNTSVLHTFGLVDGGPNRRGIEQFFGLDDGANTRIGLEYGISDRWSVGIGRMTFNKIVDINTKANILRQTTTDSMPLELAVKVMLGISTMPGLGLEFSDRLSYFTSVMIARKFDRISLQLAPMVAHFNNTAEVNPDQLFGLGIVANYEFNDRFSLGAEYLPVFGDRNAGTHDAMAVTLNIDTGGHIFQLFLASSQWHNEPFIMANNRDRFWKGDIRFGFNINRVFGIGR